MPSTSARDTFCEMSCLTSSTVQKRIRGTQGSESEAHRVANRRHTGQQRTGESRETITHKKQRAAEKAEGPRGDARAGSTLTSHTHPAALGKCVGISQLAIRSAIALADGGVVPVSSEQ